MPQYELLTAKMTMETSGCRSLNAMASASSIRYPPNVMIMIIITLAVRRIAPAPPSE